MKLQVKAKTLRLPQARPDLIGLLDAGLVVESADLVAGASLIYCLHSVSKREPVRVEFQQGTVAVIIPSGTAQTWATLDETVVYAQEGALRISIGKDFRCLIRSGGRDERDTFPHPNGPSVAAPGGATCRS